MGMQENHLPIFITSPLRPNEHEVQCPGVVTSHVFQLCREAFEVVGKDVYVFYEKGFIFFVTEN